jgi:manganese/zinc/iron transport system ATP- binding protein
MGLIPPTSGYVKLFDKPLNDVRARISYVPQRESVDWNFPASVLDVVLMGTYGKLGLFRRPGKKEKDLAMHCLEQVGMTGFVSRQISELSGGQQQRVFIARALAQEADLYLMDEPFAGVDMATETAIFQLLKDMANSGKTVLVVHHDIHSAMKFFDWIIMLNLHLVASGPKESVMTEDLLRKTYGGKLNLLTQVTDMIRNKEFNPLKN